MAEETNTEVNADAPAEKKEKEQLIMCYISKQMVPISETVEVAYGDNKKYRVLPKYIKY